MTYGFAKCEPTHVNCSEECWFVIDTGRAENLETLRCSSTGFYVYQMFLRCKEHPENFLRNRVIFDVCDLPDPNFNCSRIEPRTSDDVLSEDVFRIKMIQNSLRYAELVLTLVAGKHLISDRNRESV